MALEMKYFVLKPAGSSPHAYAAREALYAYAFEIEAHDPELAKALREWAEREDQEALR